MRSFRLTDEEKEIVAANVGLVPYLVSRYKTSYTSEYDDMISVGYIGLCKAVKNYKPMPGKKFSTYAAKVIGNTIHNELFLPYTRKKRGSGTASVELYDDVGSSDLEIHERINRSPIDPEDVEETVLNRVAMEPVWKLVPTYIAVRDSGMSEPQYSKATGNSRCTVNSRKLREFAKARRFVIDNDLAGRYVCAGGG